MLGRALRERQSVVLALLLGAAAFSGTCPVRNTRESPKSVEPAILPQAAVTPTPEPPRDLFASTVRPMLAEKCSPCHVPGGKMYERLPFDRPEVVSSHAEGVRKRLKGEDRQALERWLVTLPAPSR